MLIIPNQYLGACSAATIFNHIVKKKIIYLENKRRKTELTHDLLIEQLDELHKDEYISTYAQVYVSRDTSFKTYFFRYLLCIFLFEIAYVVSYV